MKLGLSTRFAFAVALAAVGANASAVCVSNSSQLGQALIDAQSTAMVIQMVQGTYHLENTIWHNVTSQVAIAGGSSLLGGYTPGCASRNIEVGNTNWVDTVPAPAGDGPEVFNALLFEGITFEMPLSFKASVSNSFSPSVTIRRSAVLNGGSIDFSQADDLENPGGTLTALVENTLVAGNDYGGSGCALSEFSLGGFITLNVVNSTIVNNHGSGGVCGIHYGSSLEPAILQLYNNIIWNNSGADIMNDSDATQLVDNIFHTRNFPTPSFAPVGTIDANPQLTSDYHLTEPTSPAIDKGTTNVYGGLPPYDLDGGARLIGNAVDLGAFESSIKSAFLQVVKNANDSGNDSLRQAILNAVAYGSGLISFDIPGGCSPAHVIKLQSELPDLTVPILIFGYSQSGASANTLAYGFDANICIVIEPANNATVQYAFRVPASAGSGVQAIINGFDFGGFATAPIVLNGGIEHGIGGNRFGVVNGATEMPDKYDILIGPAVSGVIIGGDDPSQRNLILTATTAGIYLDNDGASKAAHQIQILNNYVGMGWSTDHLVAHGNTGDGISVHGNGNRIANNFIGYNGGDGVVIASTFAHNNTVTGNTIGGTSTSDGNGGNGVVIESDAHDNQITSNTIDYNTKRGVRVVTGVHNKISKNYIAGNGALGIDLANLGVTGNDDDANPPTADYANRGQNFPVPTGATGGHFSGVVKGTLTTTPGDYIVEIFGTFACDAGNHGEGAPFIASRKVNVPLPSSGDQNTKTWTIAMTAPGEPFLKMPPFITATATDVAGNTSEFSVCVPYVDDTIFADSFDPVLLIL